MSLIFHNFHRKRIHRINLYRGVCGLFIISYLLASIINSVSLKVEYVGDFTPNLAVVDLLRHVTCLFASLLLRRRHGVNEI